MPRQLLLTLFAATQPCALMLSIATGSVYAHLLAMVLSVTTVVVAMYHYMGDAMRSDVQAALREVIERAGRSSEAQEGMAPVMITGDGNTIMVAGAIAVEHLHLAPRREAESRAE